MENDTWPNQETFLATNWTHMGAALLDELLVGIQLALPLGGVLGNLHGNGLAQIGPFPPHLGDPAPLVPHVMARDHLGGSVAGVDQQL